MNAPEGEETIFAEALRQPPDERTAYLAQATQGNDALRQRVERLLDSYPAGDFLEQAAAPPLRPTLQITVPVTEKPGDRIGRYKLLQQIGEGGCGVVYMAGQAEPVRRCVALKIIKLGMDTKSVIARFEAERQALALMDHPHIAKVLDAGATETGRPYFVMELVRGMRITDYCDEKKLYTHARLELFIQVCQAIQHAHQKGIIHRDIKPSNILVTVNDGVAVPKIIDFGIAKATTGQQLTDKTLFTAFEQFIGTPAYMSPEQAVLTSLDIDTRSDIYALGVLLYELLTGKTPFDAKELLSIGLDEMRRTIRETEPPHPSTRVSTLPGQELSTTAHRRGLEPPKLVSELRGDLDWIVMKCLEKDRARRYETAKDLAADIVHHLRHEPVLACPPSLGYRTRKFIRRNKTALAVGLCLTTAAIIVVFSGLVAYRHRLREKEVYLKLQATQATEKAARFNALVQEAQRLSSGVYPDFSRAEQLFTEAIKLCPEDARLYTYRGGARFELGNYRDADADLERSLELQPDENLAAHWLIAMTARQLGEEAKARQHEEVASTQAPDSKEALMAQALALPHDERGCALLTKAIDRDPFDPALYFYRGRIAYNLAVRKTAKRHYEMAVSDLEKALRGRPHDRHITETLCLCLVQFCSFFADSPKDAYGRAKELLDEWLAHESANKSALAILADWHTRNSSLKLILETCREGQQVDATCPEFALFEGWGYRGHGQPQKAVESFSRAVELRPEPYRHIYPMGRVDLHAARAQAYVLLGEREKAQEDLEIGSRWGPRSNWTFYDWYELLTCYLLLEDIPEVEHWSLNWSQIAPECPAPCEFLGRACFAGKRYGEALENFNRAVELTEGNWPRVLVRRAITYQRLQQSGAATADFNMALEAIVHDEDWCDTLAWLLVTSPDSGRWEGERAVELGTNAVALNPESARYWTTLGAAQYRAGQWQEAAHSLRKAVALDGGVGSGFNAVFLSMAYSRLSGSVEDNETRLQHQRDAQKWYRKAAGWMEENEPGNPELQECCAEAKKLLDFVVDMPLSRRVKSETNGMTPSAGRETRALPGPK